MVDDAALEDLTRHLRVKSGQDVVQDADVGRGVRSACDRHALLLTAGECDAALPNLGAISIGQLLEVRQQLAHVADALVALDITRGSKEYVILDGRVEHPGALRGVRHGAAGEHRPPVYLNHFLEDGGA